MCDAEQKIHPFGRESEFFLQITTHLQTATDAFRKRQFVTSWDVGIVLRCNDQCVGVGGKRPGWFIFKPTVSFQMPFSLHCNPSNTSRPCNIPLLYDSQDS